MTIIWECYTKCLRIVSSNWLQGILDYQKGIHLLPNSNNILPRVNNRYHNPVRVIYDYRIFMRVRMAIVTWIGFKVQLF